VDQALTFLREHPHLEALAILLGALVSGWIVEMLTARVLLKLTEKTRTDLDDQIVEACRRPLFSSVVLAGAWFALLRFDLPPTGRFVSRGVLITIAVLLWSGAGMRIGKLVLARLAARADDIRFVQPRTLPLFEIVVKTLVIGGAAYSILLAWRVDVTAWLASAGILGIAIGFAAKDTLANMLSGIFILADAPYQIGDFVILDSGERGMVTDIGIRTTRLLTRDDIQIILPNAAIANAKIVNETGGPTDKERVRVKVGVAYGSDVDHVEEVLLQVATDSEYMLADPAPRVRFRVFGESSLDYELLGWIEEPVLRGRALHELNTRVYKAFGEHGIEIPFPQRDIHIKSQPEEE